MMIMKIDGKTGIMLINCLTTLSATAKKILRGLLSHNVHNLLHITDDSKMFDFALGGLSAFQFEND